MIEKEKLLKMKSEILVSYKHTLAFFGQALHQND
jgi:hypothetical protein